MVRKCANSLCHERFRTLRQGRLFSFHHGSRIRHLWLCFICARRFDLVRSADGHYRLVRNRLPGTTLFSIGHRATLRPFHARRLVLKTNEYGPASIMEATLDELDVKT